MLNYAHELLQKFDYAHLLLGEGTAAAEKLHDVLPPSLQTDLHDMEQDSIRKTSILSNEVSENHPLLDRNPDVEIGVNQGQGNEITFQNHI